MASSFHIRSAWSGDAAAMGRLYVASWQDAYPLLLPHRALLAMSESRAQRHFEALVAAGRDTVLVAEKAGAILGLATGGRATDRGLVVAGKAAQGEVFTLYVHPLATNAGIGGSLLRETLRVLADKGFENVVVWVLRGNPARFFYERFGAKLIARKRDRQFGASIELEAYAWPDLARVLMRPSTPGR